MTAPEDLLARVKSSFASAEIPSVLVAHRCEECEGVEATFRGRHWSTLVPAELERHADALPLLTPDAYHSYLPAYLCHAVRHPTGMVAELLIYSLASQQIDRRAECAFTTEQLAAIRAVAEHVATETADFAPEIESIRQRWQG